MTIYTTNSGQHIDLAQKLGGGGEGTVYSIRGRPNLAAKVFKAKARIEGNREDKLRIMVARPPRDEMKDRWAHPSIAWPTDLLFEAGSFAGYLMPKIEEAQPLIELYNPKLRTTEFPSFTWQSLHTAAANLAVAIHALHLKGYIVGDLNEGNVFVSKRAFVTLIDTDSFQVKDQSTGQVYRCLVGKPEFTPAELQAELQADPQKSKKFADIDREEHHDAFALAILIFVLLMQGVHPFMGVPTRPSVSDVLPVHEENINRGIFPFAGNNSYVPPPSAPDYQILHPELRRLFETCFLTGHGFPSLRPKPLEWANALKRAQGALRQCTVNSFHWYGNHLSKCPWCEREGNLLQSPMTPVFPPVSQPPPPTSPPATPPPQARAPSPSPASSGGFSFKWIALILPIAVVLFFGLRSWVFEPTSPSLPTPIPQAASSNGQVIFSTASSTPTVTRKPMIESTATKKPTTTKKPTQTRTPSPTRTSRPAPTATQRSPIRSLQLVYGVNNRSIQTVGNNAIVDLSDVGSNSLNIEAVVDDSGVESVYFLLDGEPFCLNDRCGENSAPYFMAGDINGDPYDNWNWSELVGRRHTIEAIACSEDNMKGKCYPVFKVNFTVQE